jgi:TPR repeat protein
LEQAKNWLQKAVKLGDPEKIKAMASEDPDLQPLRREIGEI